MASTDNPRPVTDCDELVDLLGLAQPSLKDGEDPCPSDGLRAYDSKDTVRDYLGAMSWPGRENEGAMLALFDSEGNERVSIVIDDKRYSHLSFFDSDQNRTLLAWTRGGMRDGDSERVEVQFATQGEDLLSIGIEPPSQLGMDSGYRPYIRLRDGIGNEIAAIGGVERGAVNDEYYRVLLVKPDSDWKPTDRSSVPHQCFAKEELEDTSATFAAAQASAMAYNAAVLQARGKSRKPIDLWAVIAAPGARVSVIGPLLRQMATVGPD